MEARVSKKDRSPFSELSDDLLVEIISRMPLKSTLCCKCVCRRWRDVVSHPDHRKKLPRSTLAGFFYKTDEIAIRIMNRCYKSLPGSVCPVIDPSLSFLPKYKRDEIDIDMLDCCNGLLLCRRQDTDCFRTTTDYVICNPATERWVVVPGTDRSSEVRLARLAFDPVVSSHFHVFEFALADDTLGIYSSKAGVWTHRRDWKCPIHIGRFSSCTFFRGALYLSSFVDKVVYVDMEGNCRVILIPTSPGSCIAREVYVSQGQLYLVIYSDSDQHSIWALEDSGTENWTLKQNVGHLQLFGEYDSSYEHDYDIIIHPEDKLIFIPCTTFYSEWFSVTELKSYDMDSREHSISDLGYGCRSPYLSYVPLFSRSLADGH